VTPFTIIDTIAPVSHEPVRVGVVSLVILSVFESQESEVEFTSFPVGAPGGVVSISATIMGD